MIPTDQADANAGWPSLSHHNVIGMCSNASQLNVACRVGSRGGCCSLKWRGCRLACERCSGAVRGVFEEVGRLRSQGSEAKRHADRVAPRRAAHGKINLIGSRIWDSWNPIRGDRVGVAPVFLD